MAILVKMVGGGEATGIQQRAAVQRFEAALEAALGGAEMVAAVFAAFVRLRGVYGETPDMVYLTDAERMIYAQWQEAYSAALVAALGPHRYLDEPQFEISL